MGDSPLPWSIEINHVVALEIPCAGHPPEKEKDSLILSLKFQKGKMLIKVMYDHCQMDQGYLVKVLPSTTFFQVKQKMKYVFGAQVQRQTLRMNGLELRDDYDVEFYELVEGSEIILKYKRLPSGKKLRLTVITPTLEHYQVEVEENTTVARLKKEIQKVSYISAEQMTLFYFHNEMEVDDYELSAYFVSDVPENARSPCFFWFQN
ncbi:hypothetical protein NE237_004941 [Protea cynaroides]|uniref:Ubiquitin-like domain-containing protein n=1 Tax=Protea cynaroides TaxID=273540 RepID=A0A9Q0KJP7_9MAGN|nr:hypothetical protein NE237_004941 [Protea cynaroides]